LVKDLGEENIVTSSRGLPASLPFGTAMLPADTFADDVVLITGAEGILSRAAAIEFTRAGARIALAYSPGVTPEEIPELTALNANVQNFVVDCVDVPSVAKLFDAIETNLGAVTVLLNNPRLPKLAPVETLTLQQWRAGTQAIDDAVFVVATEFARRRQSAPAGSQNPPGAILNVIDTMAWQGGPGLAHASTAQAGVLNLTKTLAVEWGPDDIRVNAIAVGPFRGDETPASRQARREGRDLGRTLPALRMGEPHEFGWAATLLCSPYSAYTTGATFIIDGGSYIRRGINAPAFLPVREWARE
jgi:NAD(P)-dependent dehydrogenase (short-subunit alcohol dehydrogenase family)